MGQIQTPLFEFWICKDEEVIVDADYDNDEKCARTNAFLAWHFSLRAVMRISKRNEEERKKANYMRSGSVQFIKQIEPIANNMRIIYFTAFFHS